MQRSAINLNYRTDKEFRRQFWVEQMEQNYRLLEAMKSYDIRETGEELESICDAAHACGTEIVFSETKLGGQFDRIFFIRRSLVQDIISIGREMNRRGWILKIEDGFRTREMQTTLGQTPEVFDMIVRMCCWECNGQTPSLDLLDRRATCLVANYPNRGTHMMGTAVDISVLDREDGSEIWRGKPYLEMSEYTPMASPFISEEERRNRKEITQIMESVGFMHYPGEFWHYNKGDAAFHLLAKTGQPATYGPIHWDPISGDVTSYKDMNAPLTPPEVMAENLRAALERAKGLGDWMRV